MSLTASRIVPATLGFNADGTPVSPQFNDVYHSKSGDHGPWGQAEEVFLRGNGLIGQKARWSDLPHFTVLETGFGAGLNFIATARAWLDDTCRSRHLHYVSVEKHPLLLPDLRKLWTTLMETAPTQHSGHGTLGALVEALIAQWPLPTPGIHRLQFEQGRIRLTLALGDAEAVLPRLSLRAHAIYLDGFSPRRNPDLWSPRIFAALARVSAPNATFATWSASSRVRAGLIDAGFEVTREQGYGGKRHRTTGRYAGFVRPSAINPGERHAIVIGAGLAGCGVTHSLAQRGWRITLIDRRTGPAQEASGNLAGVFHPVMSRDDNLLARLSRNAFINNLNAWRSLAATHPFRWATPGALQLPSGRRRGAGLPPVDDWPDGLVTTVDAATACALTGAALNHGGLWFPQGGWLQPASLCAAQLAASGTQLTRIFGTNICRCEYSQGEWRVIGDDGSPAAQAPVLILANALDAARMLPQHRLRLKAVRGQLSYLPASAIADLKACLCGNGYLLPAVEGSIVSGATYGPDDTAIELREADHADNLRRISEIVDIDLSTLATSTLTGRASIRCVTPDRLPLIGPLPDPEAKSQTPSRTKRLPGLYCATGFASRGILWGTLAGEIIAAQLEGEPMLIEKDLLAAVDPARVA